ncbi:GNAT family N-acetyltransferase [Marinobacter gelidimuriae]
MFVMPDYRGCGIAAKLCEVAERKAREWGGYKLIFAYS